MKHIERAIGVLIILLVVFALAVMLLAISYERAVPEETTCPVETPTSFKV